MRILIGLVVKDGKDFIDKWIESIERIGCKFLVVDNGADYSVRQLLQSHPQMVQYHIQTFPNRNQSRDYQKILEMAKEEKADWVWNLDIDEIVPYFNVDRFNYILLNSDCPSIGLPLVEMRNDDKHYVQIMDGDSTLKDGRLVHKIYKTLSHFAFDKNDIHGCSIPHNCERQKHHINLLIQHFGHYTKELREQKREREGHTKDEDEHLQTWMREDESKITIKKWEDLIVQWGDKLHL